MIDSEISRLEQFRQFKKEIRGSKESHLPRPPLIRGAVCLDYMNSRWRQFIMRIHPEGIPWLGSVLYNALVG